MIKNWFTDAIYSWDTMTEQQKLAVLQKAEDYVSKIYGRDSRKIVLGQKMNLNQADGKEAVVGGFYDMMNPKYIAITCIDSPAMYAIFATFHEGIHALVSDYIRNLAPLKMFMTVDKNKFEEAMKYKMILPRIIANSPIKSLYNLEYYEELMANQEAALLLLKVICESCENTFDCALLFEKYYNLIITQLLASKMNARYLEQLLGTSFENEFQRIKFMVSKDDVINFKYKYKITDKQDDELLATFNQLMSLSKKTTNMSTRDEQMKSLEMVKKVDEYRKVLKKRNSFGDE